MVRLVAANPTGAWSVGRINEGGAESVEERSPVAGDFVTLFDISETARWTRHGESTIRRWISTGKIPSRFLTRPGGKIFMSGDQLAGLIRSWQEAEAVAEPPPRRTTRIKRRDPLAATRRGPRQAEPRNVAPDR